MGERREDWTELFRALGEAFSALLAAEWEVLREQWKGSLRNAAIAAVLFFVAACLFLVLVALAVVAAVLMVERFTELALWQATLAVAAAVLVAVLALVGIGYLAYVRRIENPVAAARERVGDHLQWWRARLVSDELALTQGDDDG